MNPTALNPASTHQSASLLYRETPSAHLYSPQQDPDRVRRFTARAVNRRIDQATDRRITRFAAMSEAQIRDRIHELDQEWDIDRVLSLHAAVLGLTGMALAWRGERRWLALPAVVLAFLSQHSIQGWCPQMPVLRRLGVRTRGEIDREKYTLLHLLESGTTT